MQPIDRTATVGQPPAFELLQTPTERVVRWPYFTVATQRKHEVPHVRNLGLQRRGAVLAGGCERAHSTG